MSLKEVPCPSGLRVAVRGMKVREANQLADAGAGRRGTLMDGLLSSCTADLLDVGPYPFAPEGKVPWEKVLLGDRFVALVGIRIATYGSEYVFSVDCPVKACQHTFDWVLDLEEDLVRKQYDPQALEAFFASKSFPFDLPDGKRAELNFLVGTDEKGLARVRKDKALSLSLAGRVVSISDIHPNDRVRYLEDLSMKDAMALVTKLDEYDGGIETDIKVRCPECEKESKVSLPFDRDFWLPSGQKDPVNRRSTLSSRE